MRSLSITSIIRALDNKLFALALLFSVFIIVIMPLAFKGQVWQDEILESSPAYNLAFNNRLALSVWEGIHGVEKIFFMRPPVHFFILAFFYKILGFSRLVTLSVPLVLAVLSFCLLYLIACLLTKDSPTAFLSSLLLGFSELGVFIAKSGRTDAAALFFYTLSLFLFLLAENESLLKKRTSLIICSAVSLGLAGQSYQLYLCLFPSFIFYFLFKVRPERKNWRRECILFTASYALTFMIWLFFILQDPTLFKSQVMTHIFETLSLPSSYSIWFSLQRLKDTILTIIFLSPLTVLGMALGAYLFLKIFPEHKQKLIAFIIMPAVILCIGHAFKGNYIEILLPFSYICLAWFVVYCMGFIKKMWLWGKKIKAIGTAFFLVLSLGVHILLGLGGRYYITIKDWRARDLQAYEKAVSTTIPPGSTVLGGPENWYALTRSGSNLLFFQCTKTVTFNWKKVSYIILPDYYDILAEYPTLAQLIRNHYQKIGRIGKQAHAFKLLDGYNRFSGYSSVIYKISEKKRD